MTPCCTGIGVVSGVGSSGVESIGGDRASRVSFWRDRVDWTPGCWIAQPATISRLAATTDAGHARIRRGAYAPDSAKAHLPPHAAMRACSSLISPV